MLNALATAGAATFAGTAGAAGEVDPHLAWAQQDAALSVRSAAALALETREGDQVAGGIMDERFRLHDLIIKTPAATVPGVLAQLQVGLWYVDPGEGAPAVGDQEPHERALRSAIAALERMATEG